MKTNKHLKRILSEATQIFNTGNKDRAIQFLSDYCSNKPKNSEIRREIGSFLQQNKMPLKAEMFYRDSLKINNQQETIHYNLGVIYQDMNKAPQAIDAYLRAIEISPKYARAYANLAYLYHQAGDQDKCQQACLTAQKLDPDSPQINHMMASLGIEALPDTADQQYIKNLYNEYASTYDQHLCVTLKSRVPQLIYDATFNHLGQHQTSKIILDLGCGTGICGQLFKPSALKMTGIDLSEEMISEAQKKNIYTALYTADITEYLKNINQEFDIVISSDVLIYIGNLSNVFEGVYKALRQNGIFTFSTESANPSDDDFVLDATGRYKHKHEYISRLAEKCNFNVLSCDETALRQQNEQNVIGRIYVLNKI